MTLSISLILLDFIPSGLVSKFRMHIQNHQLFGCESNMNPDVTYRLSGSIFCFHLVTSKIFCFVLFMVHTYSWIHWMSNLWNILWQ
jgi:hypothetical protein